MTKFYFMEYGKQSKRIILCLHGYADSNRMFTEFGALLKQKYRVIALDLPTNHNNQPQTLESLTYYIESFVKQYKLKKIILVGFSLGGIIAINYANRNDCNVKKLILLNSLPQLIRSSTILRIIKLLKPLLLNKKICLIYSLCNTNNLFRLLFRRPVISNNQKKRMRQYFYSYLGTLFNIININLTEEFNQLTIPKTIVMFKDDEIIRYKSDGKYNNSLKAYLQIFNNGGHGTKSEYWKQIASLFN